MLYLLKEITLVSWTLLQLKTSVSFQMVNMAESLSKAGVGDRTNLEW